LRKVKEFLSVYLSVTAYLSVQSVTVYTVCRPFYVSFLIISL